MRTKIRNRVRRLNSLKLWSAITGVALTIALVLTFLPMQVSVDTEGLLSIDLSRGQASPAFTARTETYFDAVSLSFPYDATHDKPPDTAEGNILFTFISWFSPTVTIDSVPSGWTLAGDYTDNSDKYALYYKVAGASEPSTYTWSLSGTAKIRIVCSCYYGDFDAEDPIDVFSNTAYRTNDTTLRAASMSVSAVNSPLVFFGSRYYTAEITFTKPTTPTDTWVEDDDAGSTASDFWIEICSMIWSGSGASGDMDAIMPSAFTFKHAFCVALNPAGGEPEPDWLDPDYGYRKQIIMNGSSTSNQTDYQMDIIVHQAISDGMKFGQFVTLGKIIPSVASTWEHRVYLENIIWDSTTNKYWVVYLGRDSSSVGAIGLAYTTDIEGNWTKKTGNPVLQKGSAGTWDDTGLDAPCLFKYGSTYYIIYQGLPDTGSNAGDIGIAKCTDIESGNWTKSGNNPIFLRGAANEWDDWRVGEPSVVWDGSKWVLFYMGMPDSSQINEKTGYATSSTADPDSWTNTSFTRYTANPVFDKKIATFDRTLAADPDVYYEDGTYYIMYAGGWGSGAYNNQGFYITEDLETFQRIDYPLLTIDTTNTYAVWRGGIIKVGSTYYMAYNGYVSGVSYDGYLAKCTADYRSTNDNIALEKTATASSTDASYPVTQAVDGDEFSSWIATAQAAWLKVDLGATYNISKVWWNRGNYTTSSKILKNFTIQISENDADWATVGNVTNNIKAGLVHSFSPTNARYVKIDITATIDGTAPCIGELKVYGAEVDQGNHVYLNNHCRDDFADVRFTQSDGTTLLDYWCKEYVAGIYSTFTVEFNAINYPGNNTFYCYYDKADATSASNGTNTFVFFDDFSGGSLDTDKWEGQGQTWAITDGWLRGTCSGATGVIMSKNQIAVTDNYIIEAKARTQYGLTASLYQHGLMINDVKENNKRGGYWLEYTGYRQWIVLDDADGFSTSIADANFDAKVTHEMKFLKSGTTMKFWVNNMPKVSRSYSWGTAPRYVGMLSAYTANWAEYDDFRVRKYVGPEPTWGTWGNEEVYSIEITNTPSSWAIGVVAPNDVKYFSADNNQNDTYALITNTGNCAVDIQIQGENIEGGSYDWVLASSAGNQTYSLYANSEATPTVYDIEVKSSSYNNLCTSLAEDDTYNWSMKFTTPSAFNSNEDGVQKSCTVTLVASAS